jgi:hypothetical protein
MSGGALFSHREWIPPVFTYFSFSPDVDERHPQPALHSA